DTLGTATASSWRAALYRRGGEAWPARDDPHVRHARRWRGVRAGVRFARAVPRRPVRRDGAVRARAPRRRKGALRGAAPEDIAVGAIPPHRRSRRVMRVARPHLPAHPVPVWGRGSFL